MEELRFIDGPQTTDQFTLRFHNIGLSGIKGPREKSCPVLFIMCEEKNLFNDRRKSRKNVVHIRSTGLFIEEYAHLLLFHEDVVVVRA